ncbi:NAC domain-containing protein 78-like [Bidens hawaiensis]|uniref:NAC domain-containing protein 78-like n=1 Tax=Bidens hawaiensis TaxID=980011 RepID=UPI00404B9346
MCPPESIHPAVQLELNEYSTDEAVFESLMRFKSGSALPLNVLSGVDPYQFTPSNLPAGMWYIWSGSRPDTESGFWMSTGETSEIHSSLVICLRKTLQFYEGPVSDGQKTNLMMQEYTTNDKCNSKPDSRALYRVFLMDDSSGGSGPPAMADHSQDQPSVANQSPDRLLEDYVLRGDYLELDDLAIPLSRTTSADSSCMTRSITSEDFFDSDALLRELGDDNIDHGSRKVVPQPTTLGSHVKESKPCTGQTSKTNPASKREPRDRCNNRTANEPKTSASSPSSSSSEGSSKGGRKHRTKKRKIMKYLCFLGS